MRTLNLGILAHVDAGKTTLTERLLYAAGVIDKVGSVDRGTTQTDFLPLERQRGITIRSAVASFTLGEVAVNLIDTPGHPDFIAEVERVLNVLDGVVLVVSAVEGVQAQTRILVRALQRLRLPTLIFINKIDRAGAQEAPLLRSITERLTPEIIAMGSTRELGTRSASFVPYDSGDAGFAARLIDLLAEHDDDLLAAYLEEESRVSSTWLRAALAAQIGQALVHPVFFGSAITGAGLESLAAGIEEFLPPMEADVDGPARATVFKVERGTSGEKVAYARVFSGVIRARDRLRFGPSREGKVTAMSVFDRGPAEPSTCVAAGQIGKLWGLGDVQIGDTLTSAEDPWEAGGQNLGSSQSFAPPTLETAVVALDPVQKGELHSALAQLTEQDPLINLRQDDRRGEMYVSLYGEVQKEVIQATLAQDYHLDVHFRETFVICTERPVGAGEAVEWLGKGGNPFIATLGFRIEPAPEGTGVELRLAVDVVSIPLYVYKSVDEFQSALQDTVEEAMQQGLCGWQITDCTVTLTQCGYASPASSARDFRLLAPLVLLTALERAGTVVCEPIHRFHAEIPADTYGAAVPLLARLGGVLQSTESRDSSYALIGQIPAAQTHELRQQLPGVTRGEGALQCEFDCYRPVTRPFPTRPRSDHNPLNRKEYLLHVVRRV